MSLSDMSKSSIFTKKNQTNLTKMLDYFCLLKHNAQYEQADR